MVFHKGSILGPLLSNIYISDIFYDIDKFNIASYADDNTPYASDFDLKELIQKLELIANNLFEEDKNNYIKTSAGKCHLPVTRDTDITAMKYLKLKLAGKKNFLVSK